jgi:ATP/maltotriose-dependent transcriptional regulator MalT
VPAEEQARLRTKAATVLRDAGRVDEAIALALHAGAWPLARTLILERAAAIISQGGRATFIEWCGRLPQPEMNACCIIGSASLTCRLRAPLCAPDVV